LLCKIYKEGYYYKWGADECLLFAKNMGAEGVSKNNIEEVIKGLLRRGFFNEELYKSFNILTSKGIQERYFEAAKRYKRIDVVSEYLLVDVSKADNVNINSINANINPINDDINSQKKGKEKKRNKTKELDKPIRFSPPSIEEIRIYCLDRKNSVDAENFYFFYESKGWMIGKEKMKDWKAAIVTWEKRERTQSKQHPARSYQPNKTDTVDGRF
jgi:hypothetical protein